jgi:DNA-binding transcriptional LysR family regulator
LERALGRRLVRRTSQGTSLEEEGLALVALAEDFERSLTAHQRDGAGASPYAGTVRVSLPDGFLPVAVGAIAKVRREHPETHVELSSEARFVDLTAREADIGVRGARSSSAVLVEKLVGEVRPGLFASSEYLKQRLPGRYLADAAWGEHDFITGDAPHGPTAWLVARGALRFPLRVSTFEGRLDAAERGLGLVMAGAAMAGARRRLTRIRLDAPLPPLSFYLVMHQDLRNVPRVRAVADALSEAFAEADAEARRADERFLQR